MQASDVVEVNARIQAAVIDSTEFDTSLIYGYHTQYVDLVRSYGASDWSEQMVAEGFPTTHPLYLALSACFKQDPKPSVVKIGRRSQAETQSVRITPVTKGNSYRHSLIVETAAGVKETAAYQEDSTPTVAEICANLASAINALNAAVTANGSSGTHIDIAADVANAYFTFRDLTDSLTLRDTTAAVGDIAADLTAIKAADNDWYGLGLASPSPVAIESCADWCEANAPHIFSASTHDMGVLTSAVDDIGTSIMGQSYQRTLVSYHSKCLQFFGPAWMASMLTYEPGQADWWAKTVIGAEPDKLTPTQESFAKAKRVTTYGSIKSAPWTGEAWTGSGYFVDLILTKDWLEARLQEFIIAKAKVFPKIPLTDEGVGALTLEAMMDTVAAGQANTAIDTDPGTIKYIVPKVSSLSQANKTARHFAGSEMSCRGTGGAHKITIKVNLAV
jgi:hypothetical protein